MWFTRSLTLYALGHEEQTRLLNFSSLAHSAARGDDASSGM